MSRSLTQLVMVLASCVTLLSCTGTREKKIDPESGGIG